MSCIEARSLCLMQLSQKVRKNRKSRRPPFPPSLHLHYIMTGSSSQSSPGETIPAGHVHSIAGNNTVNPSRLANAGSTLAATVSLSPAVSAFQYRPNSSHLKTHRSPDTLSPRPDGGSPEMRRALSNRTRSPSPVSPRPSATILKDSYVYKDEVFVLDEERKQKLRQVGEISLQSEWTFWYDRYVPNLPPTEYEANLQVISTVGTVQKFWSVYNNIDGPDRLGFRSNLHFMRKGIKPIWEDPQNEHGGSYNFKISKAQSSLFWRDLLVLLIGEKVEEWLGDTVCGVSVSSRSQCDNYQVWVAQNHHNDPERDLRIKTTLTDMLGPAEIQSFYYKGIVATPSKKEVVNQQNDG
ncbi:translation initiation factor eIF 4e-like domain-containing protein [Dichotomocladium elegans]|nr:translation initiation factor eIF 4e-like domain-containing protein [Dichotomocladium elegans]